jgi:choline dehydrogenase-like flavoprotein
MTTASSDEIYDALIIGAGPSGAVTAHTLALEGLKVICLEQGDYVLPSDYAAKYDMWELVARAHWAAAGRIRDGSLPVHV